VSLVGPDVSAWHLEPTGCAADGSSSRFVSTSRSPDLDGFRRGTIPRIRPTAGLPTDRAHTCSHQNQPHDGDAPPVTPHQPGSILDPLDPVSCRTQVETSRSAQRPRQPRLQSLSYQVESEHDQEHHRPRSDHRPGLVQHHPHGCQHLPQFWHLRDPPIHEVVDLGEDGATQIVA